MQVLINHRNPDNTVIRLNKTEIKRLDASVRLMESVSRVNGDNELRQALEVIKGKFQVLAKAEDF